MTRSLPFTAASLARAIKGVRQAGQFVVGVRPDGTLLVSSEKPVDMTSIVPADTQTSPEKRMGDYFRGGQGEAERA
jgi:hypothetical protein